MMGKNVFHGLVMAAGVAMTGMLAPPDAHAAGAPSTPAGIASTAGAGALSAPAAKVDFNGDGRSDILWHNTATGMLYALQINGLAAGAGGAIDVRSDTNWKVAAVADLNGDGKADVVWQHATTGQVYGLIMNGTAVQSQGLIYTESNTDWKIAGAGDFNGDGNADLLWRNRMTGEVFVLLLNGLAYAGGGVVYAEPSPDWQIQAVGDLNGDGRADVLWRNLSTGDVFALLMNGTAVVGGGVIYSEPKSTWQIQAAADFNGDGKADILWRNTVTGDVFMMLMDGLAISGGGIFYSEPDTAWKIVASGDYDGNGRADILWRNTSSGAVYVMLMNGTAVTGGGVVYTEPDANWTIPGAAPGSTLFNCLVKDKFKVWNYWVAGNSYSTANAPLHDHFANEIRSVKFRVSDLFTSNPNAASSVQVYESGSPMVTISLSASPCEFTNSPAMIQCQRSGNSGSLGLSFVAHTHSASDATLVANNYCRAPAPTSDSIYVNVRFSGPPHVVDPPASTCTETICPYYLLYMRLQ